MSLYELHNFNFPKQSSLLSSSATEISILSHPLFLAAPVQVYCVVIWWGNRAWTEEEEKSLFIEVKVQYSQGSVSAV